MALIKQDSKIVMGSLVFLLNRLATALEWVRQQKGKIQLDVQGPARVLPTFGPYGGGCPRPLGPDDRADVEILIAVLSAMEEAPAKASKAKSKRKAKPRK